MQSSGPALIGIDGKILLPQNPIVHKASVNLLVTGQTTIVPSVTGCRFVPLNIYCEISSLTGAYVVVPILRLGNSVNYDNVAPLHPIPGALVVGSIEPIPTVGTLTSINVSTAGIAVDVQTAATIATQFTANIYLFGFYNYS